MDVKIWKFPLSSRHTTIKAPAGSEPLYVGVQKGEPHIWVRVPHYEPGRDIEFEARIFATGAVFDNGGMQYVGTYMFEDYYIWHVYWLIKSYHE